MFPDPSNSPTRHTRSLSVRGLLFDTAVDGDMGSWICPFQNLVHLHLECLEWDDYDIPLASFHGLSPTLRSLRLTSTSSEVLGLICSFPLLEDLALVSLRPGGGAWNTPSISPKLTGSLDLRARQDIRPVARRLLGLLDGLRFSRITVACYNEAVEP